MIPTVAANGAPAFGQYKPSETGEGYEPWALQVLEIEDGRIVELTFFLDTETVFPLFGLPLELEAVATPVATACACRQSLSPWGRCQRTAPDPATTRRPGRTPSPSSSADACRRRTWQPYRCAAS